MAKSLKIFLVFLIIILALFITAVLCYFFIGKAQVQENITWGVDFSQSQTEYLKLDWKQTYTAIINDLGAKNIKLHTNWDWVEGKRDDYFFEDIDWQIKQAEENKVKIIYVLGMKTGRWPECHTPSWANDLSADIQKQEALEYITKVVQRYKNSKAVSYWQVENEPLFKFGECPAWYYQDDSFLKTEVALIRSLDPSRQIIISDSGEQSTWIDAAKIGDIVGITMYRNAWLHITDTIGFNMDFFILNPATYYKKAQLIKKMFGKKVICIELQAEPWTSKGLMEASLQEQTELMNENILKKGVEFARRTGMDTFYFWGVEWWYQMKTQYNDPSIWNQAKPLFQ